MNVIEARLCFGMRQRWSAGVFAVSLGLTQLGSSALAQAGNPLSIDARRSLAVTDLAILERFTLERVMNQLAELSGVPGLTGISLFRQWWDTQNSQANGVLESGPHCDDTISDGAHGVANGVSVLNGYPYICRAAPHEGRQVSCTSFDDPDCAYRPVGLFNRFDLAAQDGSTCGEHRIIFAKKTGLTSPLDRNLVIFEASMPNPNPTAGLNGCRPLIEAWARQSAIGSLVARARQLETMYFQGIGAASPAIVHPSHYGDNPQGLGQIRTNQFAGFGSVSPKVWTLREFKLRRACPTGGACQLLMTPVPDAVNAFGPLFAPTSLLPAKVAFDAFLPSQVASLAAETVAGIGLQNAGPFNSAQSNASGPSNEMNYTVHFGGDSSPLGLAVGAALTTLGSALSATHIVARAQTMTCAGCHQLSNNANLGGDLVWPPSLGFTHVTERLTEVVGGSERFLISAALEQSFLPHRKQIMESFLTGSPLPFVRPGLPIGGRAVH